MQRRVAEPPRDQAGDPRLDHLRRGSTHLEALLEEGTVTVHPFVIGELACGMIRRRAEVLSLLDELPEVSVATHREVLRFIEEQRLAGRGLGYTDVHLLASAALDHVPLWTLDRRLAQVAARLGLGHSGDSR